MRSTPFVKFSTKGPCQLNYFLPYQLVLGTSIFEPSFAGDSYISYEGLMTHHQSLQITMMFRPTSTDDAVLLFNGYAPRGKGDYVAIMIKDQKLVFQYDSGSGECGRRKNSNICESHNHLKTLWVLY